MEIKSRQFGKYLRFFKKPLAIMRYLCYNRKRFIADYTERLDLEDAS